MNRYLVAFGLLAATLTTGCAARAPAPAAAASLAPQVSAQVQLTGRLALKGNMPMLQTVLTLDNGERWELTNIEPLTAAQLQNKRVVAEGKVVRPAATPMLLRSVAVQSIAIAP